MRNMKKWIALALAATIGISAMMTGCSGKDESAAGNASGETEKEKSDGTGGAAEEPVTLNVMVWCRGIDNLDFDSMEFYDEIEERTGIHAVFNKVMESDWGTKTNLMFTSGEYPDIIMSGGVDVEMYGVDQGILIPIDEYIDEYMPIYSSRLAADESMADAMRVSDGKMYFVGKIVPQNINVDGHLFINEDWLEAVNKEVPETIDEFEEVLRAFKEEDPNRNGEADEIPYTANFDDNIIGLLNLLSFWGIPFNPEYASIDEDGKTVYSWLYKEGLRDALETIHRWYEDGLIDIEAISQDYNAVDAKINSGLSGAFFRWRMLEMGTDESIAEQYKCILPISADGYKANVHTTMEIPTFGAAITSSCTNIEAACKWLDAQLDLETMLTSYNGASMWSKNEETGMYDILGVDNSLNIPGQSGLFFISGEEYFEKVNMPVHRVEKSNYCKEYADAGVLETYSSYILTRLCNMTVEENDEKARLKAEIKKYVDEMFTDFITHGVTDDGWNTFISTLDDLKMDRYIEIYQAAYNRYLEAH